MAKRLNLSNAKVSKKDEFYTQLEDIEKEMAYYKELFPGKVVYCNCDNADKSKFSEYFASHFNELGLKKLICTSYNPEGNGQLSVYHGNGEWIMSNLAGDGDFRSNECLEYLSQCDIVVTNPPFSLFREFVSKLVEYGKQFLIIGNQNAITYKEIFPLIRDNKLWLGRTMNGSNRWFEVPKDYEVNENAAGFKEIDGKRLLFVNGVAWFTNMPHEQRNLPIKLEKTYNSSDYPKYCDYDAIEVNKVCDIPYDYDGAMGVPISFLYKYCPEQFEIVECHEPCIELEEYKKSSIWKGELKSRQVRKNDRLCQKTYHRIFIRNRH